MLNAKRTPVGHPLPRPAPVGVQIIPMIKYMGNIYRCRGGRIEGWGTSAVHAWNAWCTRVETIQQKASE